MKQSEVWFIRLILGAILWFVNHIHNDITEIGEAMGLW